MISSQFLSQLQSLYIFLISNTLIDFGTIQKLQKNTIFAEKKATLAKQYKTILTF